MKRICKYHLFEKRDGSIVNHILQDDGTITSDGNEVSSILIQALKEIQYSSNLQEYGGDLQFPELSDLTEDEVCLILSTLSTGKALSFDIFSDEVLKNKSIVKKLSFLLKDLWSDKLGTIEGIENIFKARLVALNKVHPNTPKKNEFRPIIIMSLIIKILESRWLPKLQDYMISELCPAQSGFVPGQGVFPNIHRVIRRIKYRTNQGKNVYALFIDFKSAYNFARHDLLFERLKNILDEDEINFQKALYDKITIQSGKSFFKPNLGVAQGSIISPALFAIYLEPLLWELNKLIPLADIFAYADDVLILCDDLNTLERCTQVIETWSQNNNMKINTNKSAVMEFINRMKKKLSLKIGNTIMGYPIVSEYKYLGTWLNQKLTLETQINHIVRKMNFTRDRLSPILYNASLALRKNLWQVFITPMFEFTLPLYSYEKAELEKVRLETLLRRSFKNFTGLRKNVSSELIQDFMGYNLKERSEYIQYVSEKKWEFRTQGKKYIGAEDPHFKFLRKTQGSKDAVNLCKDQPKLMIKYINMQTTLCQRCKEKDIITRCSKSHLSLYHHVYIADIYSIASEVLKKTNKVNWSRKKIMKFAETILQPSVNRLKNFLACL